MCVSATCCVGRHSDLYKNTLKQYLENKYVVDSTGFKPLAELINGRAAMLGKLMLLMPTGCCRALGM